METYTATYMSVERQQIQKAFALAHKLACNEHVPAAQRNQFRAIASLIWQSCGEPKPMPTELPAGFAPDPGKGLGLHRAFRFNAGPENV